MTYSKLVKIKAYILGLLVSALWSGVIDARPDIMQAWQARYPSSTSSDRDCQLCHQRVDGGDGWNSYGISIRFQFIDVFGSLDIDAAFAATEMLNSDGDDAGLSNLVEIERGLDPGWRAGPNNPIFYKVLPTLENQLPPFSDIDGQNVSEELCFVLVPKSGAAAVVCL